MFGIDEWVPESLDTIPPGYVLAAMLDNIDLDRCTGYDRIRVLRAQQRMSSHYSAQVYNTMNSVVDAMSDDPDEADFAEEAAAAEIAAALRLTRRATDVELSFALELKRRLPGVWDALCEGSIDVRRARVIVDNTLHLTIGRARIVVESVIDDAGLLTTGQLGAKLRKLCIDRDPDDAKDRYHRSLADRCLVSQPDVSGTADLIGTNLAPDRVTAIKTAINEIAKKLHGNDPRTMDQLRADIYLDALETGIVANSHYRTNPGGLNLTVTLASLARLTEASGDLDGYGPVIADIARQVAQRLRNSQWGFTLLDSETGLPIDGGITRRRPNTAQRRFVRAQYRHCVHPGCRMPATESDIDHRIPWAESHTTKTQDLAPLCRYHHTIRHRHRWTYQPTNNNDFEFTTPLGHTYTTSGRSP